MVNLDSKAQPKPKQKQKARRLLVQALYSWQVGGTDLIDIEAEFHVDNDMAKVDGRLFHDILFGVPKNLAEIDGCYTPHLDRENKDLDPVSRAVLRIATYELMYSIEVPYKVVINEGVNLAKTYGPTDAFKFINGVLDKVAIEKRAIEVAAKKRS
ncbi:transcription antitermination factor NusB [bacterium]|jgi:N utilization substance protein B|nr:transcription antitermination factor NusB [bacterium]